MFGDTWAHMPNYRRVFIPGGTSFLTVNLLERRTKLLTENIQLLKLSIGRTQRKYPFRLEALVILPNHLHAVITLPPSDSDYPTRVRLFKSRFAKSLPKTERLSAVRKAKGERSIWQRRYWEHSIRDERDFMNHVAYCYYNPVKHGWSKMPVIGRIQPIIAMCALDDLRKTINSSGRQTQH